MRIYELRKSKNLTQKELGDKIGVMNYTIANWEQDRSKPSVDDLITLADFFECSIDYLVGREDDYGNVVINEGLSNEQQNALSIFSSLSEKRRQTALSVLKDMISAEKNNL